MVETVADVRTTQCRGGGGGGEKMDRGRSARVRRCSRSDPADSWRARRVVSAANRPGSTDDGPTDRPCPQWTASPFFITSRRTVTADTPIYCTLHTITLPATAAYTATLHCVLDDYILHISVMGVLCSCMQWPAAVHSSSALHCYCNCYILHVM